MSPERASTLFGLDGRRAIVTGGTRGIGRSIAEGFVDAGAKVAVVARRPDLLAETVEHLRARGGEAIGVSADMGELDDMRRIVEETVEAFGGIDILVNNAANPANPQLGQLTAEVWEDVQNVNLRGPVFLVEAALPHLTQSPHASVINVISAAAYLTAPGIPMYTGFKAALLAFTRSMAADFAPRGIRVNAIAPGCVWTEMTQDVSAEAQEIMAGMCLQRRIADADELIGPAVFLASDASSFITGQAVSADGGLVSAR